MTVGPAVTVPSEVTHCEVPALLCTLAKGIPSASSVYKKYRRQRKKLTDTRNMQSDKSGIWDIL